jgi:DsbC/DsbD-like thiol-disulfide interchange protein
VARRTRQLSSAGASVLCAALVGLSDPVAASGLVTPWVDGYSFRVRMLAGMAAPDGQAAEMHAAIEVRMLQGWKTYWRTPGDSGGLPPHFDWSGSANVDTVEVLYPAPRRFRDADGFSVGYSGRVVFPVQVRPKDPARPMELKLTMSFGVCREICVPAEAKLELSLPQGRKNPADPEITAALETVPRPVNARRSQDPQLRRVEAHIDGKKPRLVIEASFPAGADTADLFVEAPDGIYVPLPTKTRVVPDAVEFEVDLTQASDPEALRGKTLLITMVSEAGNSEARWAVP